MITTFPSWLPSNRRHHRLGCGAVNIRQTHRRRSMSFCRPTGTIRATYRSAFFFKRVVLLSAFVLMPVPTDRDEAEPSSVMLATTPGTQCRWLLRIPATLRHRSPPNCAPAAAVLFDVLTYETPSCACVRRRTGADRTTRRHRPRPGTHRPIAASTVSRLTVWYGLPVSRTGTPR